MSILTGIPIVKDIIGTVFGSKQERDLHQAAARKAVYDQFKAEFQHNTTYWDSFINGINRLPRPIMTFGIIYLFWLCWSDPVNFARGADALTLMPKEGWYVIGAIVTFWFAARLPSDFGKYKYNNIMRTAQPKPEPVKPVLPVKGDVAPIKPDVQAGVLWNSRIEKRYKDL